VSIKRGSFQGIMLGGIILLLKDSKTVEEFDEIDDFDRIFFVSELTEFLSKIIDLRNDHAHIKAMSLEKFNELYNTLFDHENIEETKLFKLLEFKKIIVEYIKNH